MGSALEMLLDVRCAGVQKSMPAARTLRDDERLRDGLGEVLVDISGRHHHELQHIAQHALFGPGVRKPVVILLSRE